MKKIEVNSLRFDTQKGTMMADVSIDINDFDCLDFIQQNQFHTKKEFHLTIIGFQEGKNIIADSNKLNQLNTIAERYNSNQEKIECTSDGTLLFIEKEYPEEHRFSLITPCTSGELDNLRQDITAIIYSGEVSNQKREDSYWHITLATRNEAGQPHDGIGVNSKNELLSLRPKVVYKNEILTLIKKFIVPTRVQPDTAASMFLLQEFAQGVGYTIVPDFEVEINPQPKNDFWNDLANGTMQLDCIGGLLDHHSQKEQTTLTTLVKIFLNQQNNPSLDKLSAYVERDDFHGKGTISTDVLDKAFGLSGLLTAFNKVYADNPTYIAKSVIPLFKAHYEEEKKRNEYLPQLVGELKKDGKISELKTKQRKKKIDIIFVESDEPSLPGYLRSSIGGRYDVVVQRRASGHTNIITRPLKSIDMRSLVVLVRKSELLINKKSTDYTERYLASEGVLKEISQWYYDRATNTLQNGGLNEGGIEATSIPLQAFKNIVEAGISEKYWSPLQ